MAQPPAILPPKLLKKNKETECKKSIREFQARFSFYKIYPPETHVFSTKYGQVVKHTRNICTKFTIDYFHK
ncbi:hypothetical protein MPC4_70063 [Methylocella tundrae]|uniref:Uncharacterized protein n=1 Tax=Methylocella tundrae TaxID=227605 RepID=A0A8B6MC95_METTU|nr:hypothetical protein MPC4_70063 [Methylocella tundrae]